jgi:hypothetical protein
VCKYLPVARCPWLTVDVQQIKEMVSKQGVCMAPLQQLPAMSRFVWKQVWGGNAGFVLLCLRSTRIVNRQASGT